MKTVWLLMAFEIEAQARPALDASKDLRLTLFLIKAVRTGLASLSSPPGGEGEPSCTISNVSWHSSLVGNGLSG